MNKKLQTYEQLLKNSPAHDSPEFLEYLKQNNVVVFEDQYWLFIRNFKYWREDRPWVTAFAKTPYQSLNELVAIIRVLDMGEWTWLKKSADTQSVKRFHLHIHK